MPPNANRWPKPPEIPLIKARGIGWLRDGFNALKEPKTKRLRPAPAYPYGDKQRLVRLIIEPRPHQPRSGGAFSFGRPALVDRLGREESRQQRHTSNQCFLPAN